MGVRHNCVSLEGLHPSGQATCEFWIDKDLIQFFYRRSQLDKFKELHLVKEVLLAPAAIFEGLCREGHEESLCYAGLASCCFSRDGNQLPAPKGMTFAVYILEDYKIFRWGWERADKNLTYPLDYNTRFRQPLWPKN